MPRLGLMLSLAVLAVFIGCNDDDPGETAFQGTVSGTVTNAVSGDPVANARIELRQGDATVQSTVTDTDGNYQLQDQVLGEETYSILASANGFEDFVVNEFTLTSGVQTREADIQLTPLTPVLEIAYADGQSQLNIEGGALVGTVTIRNTGEGELIYTDLGTPAWMDATDEDGNQQGTIAGGGGSESITITVNEAQVQSFLVNNQVSGTVSIDTDQDVNGDKEINVRYTQVIPNEPPEGEIDASPSGPYLMRQLITFSAVNLSDDSDLPDDLEVSWRFEEGGSFTSPTTTKTIQQSYTSPGTKLVTLRISDSEGATTDESLNVIISENVSPSGGSFNIDQTASELFVNVPITFTATNWVDDQVDELSLLSYTWDFGDGTITSASPSNVSISHTYTEEQSAVVVLTVTDLDGGTGSTTNTFTINPVGQPSLSIASIPSTDIGSNFVIAEGSISDLGNGSAGVTEYGFVYGTSSNPTVDDNKLNLGAADEVISFVGRIDDLLATTTYNIRAYAINESGEAAYSSSITFQTTIPVAPTAASVYSISGVTQTTATITIEVDNLGVGVTASEVGVVINIASAGDPSLSDFDFKESSTSLSVGQSDFSVSGLSSETSYRVRAYITTSDGSTLSTTRVFTTN